MYLRNDCFAVPRFLNPQTANHIEKFQQKIMKVRIFGSFAANEKLHVILRKKNFLNHRTQIFFSFFNHNLRIKNSKLNGI